VGAGPARERVALAIRQRLPRGIPETFPSRKPAPGSGGPVQDTPRVHPRRLGVWPSLAKHGPGRAHPIPALLGNFQACPPWRVQWCYDPWRCRCQVSGAMVRPGGSCLARDGQTNSGHGWLERSRKASPLPRVSDTEHRRSENPGLWYPAGSSAPFRGRGPLPQGPTDTRPLWREPPGLNAER
jgi:hypothetical protein